MKAKKEKQPPNHGLKGRERHLIFYILCKKKDYRFFGADFDQMTLDEIRKELPVEDIRMRDFPAGYGELTYNNVIKILGGTPPPKTTHRKRKTFRLFGRKIIISIY